MQTTQSTSAPGEENPGSTRASLNDVFGLKRLVESESKARREVRKAIDSVQVLCGAIYLDVLPETYSSSPFPPVMPPSLVHDLFLHQHINEAEVISLAVEARTEILDAQHACDCLAELVSSNPFSIFAVIIATYSPHSFIALMSSVAVLFALAISYQDMSTWIATTMIVACAGIALKILGVFLGIHLEETLANTYTTLRVLAQTTPPFCEQADQVLRHCSESLLVVERIMDARDGRVDLPDSTAQLDEQLAPLKNLSREHYPQLYLEYE